MANVPPGEVVVARMKTTSVRNGAVSRGDGLGRGLLAILSLFLVAVAPSLADPNSWIKPDNGFSDEQAVCFCFNQITNAAI